VAGGDSGHGCGLRGAGRTLPGMQHYAPPPGYGQPHPQAYVPPPQQSAAPAEVSERTAQVLHETKPWVSLFSILMFLGIGLMVLAAFAVLGMSMLTQGAGATALLGLVYLPMAALYAYPAVKLWKYQSAIGRLLANRQVGDLEAALAEQKSFWKFSGIVTLVVICLYVVFAGIAALGMVAAFAH
jgi:hypothetical protein